MTGLINGAIPVAIRFDLRRWRQCDCKAFGPGRTTTATSKGESEWDETECGFHGEDTQRVWLALRSISSTADTIFELIS